MIVGYARVSTNAQADGEALDQQIARLKAAGAEDIFVDVESGRSVKRSSAVSGACPQDIGNRRPQFKKLLALVETGKVKELIIARIDRLGRSVISLHKAIKLIEENGVELRVLDASVDPNSPFGWFSISKLTYLPIILCIILLQFTLRLNIC
ncbi:recombinase family protein [Scytonema tolypothrichoides VB-61278]|nr:recombinase family protein [Scytonema tolypothrichoides VB-61278]